MFSEQRIRLRSDENVDNKRHLFCVFLEKFTFRKCERATCLVGQSTCIYCIQPVSFTRRYLPSSRASKLIVEATYQWPVDTDDPDTEPGFYDDFERPPFNVLFRSLTGSREYVMCRHHFLLPSLSGGGGGRLLLLLLIDHLYVYSVSFSVFSTVYCTIQHTTTLSNPI